MGHTHLGGHVAHTVNRTVPHDVLNINVVTHKRLAVVVDVDDTHETVTLLSEKIKEGGVLPERVISVRRIVGG